MWRMLRIFLIYCALALYAPAALAATAAEINDAFFAQKISKEDALDALSKTGGDETLDAATRASALAGKAEIYKSAGEIAEARAELQAAAALDPQTVGAYRALFMLEREQGNFAAASGYLDMALKNSQKPDSEKPDEELEQLKKAFEKEGKQNASQLAGEAGAGIPYRYALHRFSGADPKLPLDSASVITKAKKAFEEADVEQGQFVVYDQGKKPGDGMRVLGEISKDDAGVVVVTYQTFEGEDGAFKGKGMENMLGYKTTPQELYDAYYDNEVVADDDFRGKPVIMRITVPQVSKDITGKPYIRMPMDKPGLSGIQILLAKSDPFLRAIKRGSDITVRVYPEEFLAKSVVAAGAIVKDEAGGLLVDGKRVVGKSKK